MRIHADHQPYRKKPYVARWYEGTRQRNKFFASAAARDEFIHQLKETAQRQDPVLPTIAPHQLIRWQQAIAIAPDADPVEVFKFWKSEQRKIAKLGDRYLLEMKRAGRDPEYQKHTLRALTRFASHYGDKAVEDITSTEISEFIHGLPFQALTKRHYRTYLVGAFKWFVKQGWAQSNPAAAVPSPKIQLPEPGILTVKETEALFRKNEKVDPEICGLLALGAFAGMRSSAI